MKKLKKIAGFLNCLLSTELNISAREYRIVVSDRLGPMIDVYFLDIPFDKFGSRKDLALVLTTIETLMPDTRIRFRYVNKKHFDEVSAA